jgi:hypothetical protein
MAPIHLDCMIENTTGHQFSLEAATATALRIVSDPTNHSVTCSCGVVFLSGAAQKDATGRPLCIECGAACR